MSSNFGTQTPHDEFDRLAEVMRKCFSRPAPSRKTIQAFKKIGIDIAVTDRLSDQIREYCEWNCTTFPIDIVKVSETLEYALFNEYEDEVGGADIANVLSWMGFKRPTEIRQGPTLRLQEIDLSIQKLQGQSGLTVPKLNREEIHGNVMTVFSFVEELLEYTVSYYARWLTASVLKAENVLGSMKHVPDVLEWGKQEKWIVRKWSEDWEKLIFEKSLPLLYHLNELVSRRGTQFSTLYQETFKFSLPGEFPIQSGVEDSVLIVPSEVIEKANKQFSEYRHRYAHYRGREETNLQDYLDEAITTIKGLMDFADYMVMKKVVPEVAIIRRRMTFGDGTIRLDCWHEDKKLRPHRFPHFFRFYYHRGREIETFFPRHILQRLDDKGSGQEAEYLRLIVPLDFRQEEGIQLI